MARHLWRVESPLLARDRLIFELTVAGLKPGQVARIGSSSIVAGGEQSVERSPVTAGGDVTWTETGIVDRCIVIAGQRRRGGKQDPPIVMDLSAHPQLESALDRWLSVRTTKGDNLLFGHISNPVDHVRKSLIRTAEIAEVGWRPARNAVLDIADTVTVRAALDDRASWGGELIRQRDHVMLLLGWNAALRRSELCALTVADIDFDPDRNTAGVWIGRSKTDQEAVGAEVPIRNPQNMDLPEVHVVTLLRAWTDKLRSLGATDDYPLFPSFDRHGALKTKKSSRIPNAITPERWSERLAELAVTCNVFGPEAARKYELVSGHSLRRGFVTQAILRGHNPVVISKLTRHKNVQMIATYADQVLARQADWTSYLFGGDQLTS